MDGQTDRGRDGQTEGESDFKEGCPTNVKRPKENEK